MFNSLSYELFTQHFRFYNRNCSNQRWPPLFVDFHNFFNNGIKFLFCGSINAIWMVCTMYGFVCRYRNDFQFVYLVKFCRLCHRSACHPRKLFIQSIKILEGNRGKGLVFFLNALMLLRLYGLMQAIAPYATFHQASCKFIHDDNLTVFDDVVPIVFKHMMGTKGLFYIVRPLHIRTGIKAVY